MSYHFLANEVNLWNCEHRKRLQLLYLEEILAKMPITKINRVINCRVGRKQTGVFNFLVTFSVRDLIVKNSVFLINI